MLRENWDDLRYVLAAAEEGSVSGAARRLGVNHATVLRRIGAFEERAGISLFNKTARGYSVPADRRRVLEAAREVEGAVAAVERLLHGARAPLSGDVRVTSTDTFCQAILPPIVAGLRRGAPDLRIDLLCSNAHVDLSRTHADVTVRPTEKLPDNLIGDAVAQLGFGAYRARGAGALGWLGLAGPLAASKPGAWLAAKVDPSEIVGAADSFIVLREMAAAGGGLAILPCILGEGDERLEPVEDVMPPIATDIWVATHTDLADVPRISQVRTLLVTGLAERAAQLLGKRFAGAG